MFVRAIYRGIRRSLLHLPIRTAVPTVETNWNDVTVAGFMTLAVGLGEGARLCAEALAREPGLFVSAVDVGPSTRKRPEQAWSLPPGSASGAGRGTAPVALWHLNPPMMPPAVFWYGRRRYANQVNIAFWAWEFDTLPREWTKALRYVNAILAPSEFTAGAIRACTAKPVLVVPHPVPPAHPDKPAEEPDIRARLGLRPSDFVVSAVFSFGSAMDRKNPVAAVESFRRSWADEDGAVLVVKTAHGADHPAQMATLSAAVAGARNIHLVDDIWTREEIAALIRTSNAFLSLHRSEGFGLNILEAIQAGTPVVTTGWSGNTDFCDPDATALVRSTAVALTPEQARSFDLPAGRWADADTGHAAALLQAIRADPAAARARANQARAFARDYLAGRTYKAALDRLRTELTPAS